MDAQVELWTAGEVCDAWLAKFTSVDGNPCASESGSFLTAIKFTDPCSTSLLGLGIEEIKHFSAMDLPG